MSILESVALERELARYMAIRDNSGATTLHMAALLDDVITSGSALYDFKFGQNRGSRLESSAISRLKRQLIELDEDISNIKAKADADKSRKTIFYEIWAEMRGERNGLVKELRDEESKLHQGFRDAKATYLAATSDQTTAPVRGIFAKLQVNSADSENSSHKNETTRFVYYFLHDPTIYETICRFQDRCLEAPAVASFTAPDTSRMGDRLENKFVDHVIADLGPRVAMILQSTMGLQDVRLRKLATNNGVDMELVAFLPHALRPLVAMPIEGKRWLIGTAVSESGPEVANYSANFEVLSKIGDLPSGKRSPVYLFRSLSQTATYIEGLCFSQNRGVMLSKDSVVLLHRTNRNTVLISDIIEYTSTRPHPAAAIAYWVQEALYNPSRTIRLDKPALAYDSARASSASSHEAIGGSGRGLGSSARRTEMGLRSRSKLQGPHLAPGNAGSSLSSPANASGGGQKQKTREANKAAANSRHSSMTAIDATMVIDPAADPLASAVDLANTRIDFVKKSRCGFIYSGKWADNQDVVAKVAPLDDQVLRDELCAEIRAYNRLQDLQGTIVPQVVAYGQTHAEGEEYGILVVEKIEGEEILAADKMDTRPALTKLSDAEKTACLNALGEIHKRGVVHRDIRGANLLFRRQRPGKPLQPVFIDFGFSELSSGPESSSRDLAKKRESDYSRLLDAFKGLSIYT
ncbi:hypothetical protein EV183_005496 [Coemansia sp. RSA 2336]|nr:hypothetical protein EV183_005496 [Coemansia sp. RSA 2336]